MAVNNISKIECTLLGINAMSGAQGEAIHEEWGKRFSQMTSFLIDAEPDDSEIVLTKKFRDQIAAAGISAMAGKLCVLAVFLDLTGELDDARFQELSKVPARLKIALGCSVVAALQFGYCGTLGLSAGAPARRSIQRLVEHNIDDTVQTQLVLTASPALAAGTQSIWQPAMLLLDLLRRQPAPAALLPETADHCRNNDVGFLSHLEYDRGACESLEAEAGRLTASISDEGADRFKEYLRVQLGEMKADVEKRFPIDGLCQPQHPDMRVPEGGLFGGKRKKAMQGKYEPYNIAANLTGGALKRTAEALTEAVTEMFRLSDAEADRLLPELIARSRLGLGAAARPECMKECLSSESGYGGAFPLPGLRYLETGCAPEIESYLLQTRLTAMGKGEKLYRDALLAAYDRLPNGYFFDKICENRTKLEKVRAQLGDKLDAGTFRSRAAAGMLQLNGEFNTSEPSAVSKTYLLLRGAEMKELADGSPLGFGSVQEFYIDEKMGGIQKLDNAPMKLLRLTLLDCTETSLLDLIQEI